MTILTIALGWDVKNGRMMLEYYVTRIPIRLKGKVYRMVVRPDLLYEVECWPIKKTQIQKLIVNEMRESRLRWFGHVKRRSVNAPVRRYETINLMHYRRGRGQSKMS